MKTVLIDQPFGLGDIFFLQKIAYYYLEKDYEVIWPVIDKFMYVSEYIKNDIKFVKQNSKITYDKKVNLAIFNTLKSESCMEARYKAAGIDFRDWANYFKFERNLKREDALYYKTLNLKDDSEFALINNNVSDRQQKFNVNSKLNKIYMKIYHKSHIFDWCKVFEKAAEIYTVDTSIQFLIEVLHTTEKLHVWPRSNKDGFIHINNLFNKNWIMHTKPRRFKWQQ